MMYVWLYLLRPIWWIVAGILASTIHLTVSVFAWIFLFLWVFEVPKDSGDVFVWSPVRIGRNDDPIFYNEDSIPWGMVYHWNTHFHYYFHFPPSKPKKNDRA
jgi:hypothetical protein